MIDGLKPYPEMRPSGLPWLGDVPAHWDVLRAKYLFREIDSRSETGQETHLSMSQRLGLVPASQVERSLIAESYVGAKLVEKKDLVLNRLKAHLGVFSHSNQSGIVSPDYTVLRPQNRSNVIFFEYLLKSPACRGELRIRAKGIVEGFWRLYTDDFYCIRLPTPPLNEQAHIVRFLNWHGIQTTKLIHSKRKIISFLEERKQITTRRYVSRGTGINATLVPSGVAWLGEVRKDWKVTALRHRYDQCLGKMLDVKRIKGTHSVPYLRNIDVQWERINTHDLPRMDVPAYEYDRYTLKSGDLLVCEGGVVGRAAIWLDGKETTAFQKALHRLRPHKPDCDVPRFLLLQLRLAVAFGAFIDGHASTIAHLTGEKLRAHRFVFPSFEEQMQIVNACDQENSQTDRSIERIKAEIVLIQEFRTRLIADVVTGKLDVRAAAANLPALAEADPADALMDDDDLDEAADAFEDEEVAA